MSEPLAHIEDLSVSFPGKRGRVSVVDEISLDLHEGEVLALVGESGCGKTMAALALMRLVPKPGRVEADSRIWFDGKDLLSLPVTEMRGLRGYDLSMIFQDPMTSLNPVVPVGDQVVEAIRLHESISYDEARNRVIELFERVGIPDAEHRFSTYPHLLSGGLKQRVMISMAVATRPRLLIADEPTTALDVTVQAQILELLRELQRELGTTILLITHDFAVVNELADRVAVMYAGKIVEEGSRRDLLTRAQHPYTVGLLGAIPKPGMRGATLNEIQGVVPPPDEWPTGCRFSSRCPRVFEPCEGRPAPAVLVGDKQTAWCHALEKGSGR
jgi:peptide/nickel transport system ATP-binding protein